MQRRLTTIVAADVAGYSRLIGLDEEGTLSALRGHRAALIDPLLEQYGGRVANTAGDSLLIEFPSAVEAVRCAMAVQEGMAERNADAPDDRRIEFRVGINVGDVVDQDGDLLGDGVNIAARLEAQAPPGGIVLSRTVRDQVRDRLDLDLADLGEVEVKNIARPVRVFQVAGEGVAVVSLGATRKRRWVLPVAVAVVVLLIAGIGSWQWQLPEFEPADPAKMAYALGDKPSIAVLAFDNLTGDPEQEHISDGISEDIISTLARLPGLVVISRNSSFVYKGTAIDIREIAEETSVRYVLEGSIQQSDDTIRITAQLIDALSGYHVWSENFDRPRADFFAVRDEITKRIVRELNIEIVEGDAYWNRPNALKTMETWLLARRAESHVRQANKTDNEIALSLAYEILASEPESLWAYSSIAWRNAISLQRRWANDRAETLKTAIEFAKKAIALDPSAPDGYGAMAIVRFSQGRIEEAISLAEKAIEHAPGDSAGLALLAIYYQKDMQAERSIELFERAVRINRRAAAWIWENYGEALIMAGRYEGAIPVYLEALRSAKGATAAECHLGLAVAFDALDQQVKAREEIRAAVDTAPNLSIAYLRDFQSYKDQEYKENWLARLSRLGLPEE